MTSHEAEYMTRSYRISIDPDEAGLLYRHMPFRATYLMQVFGLMQFSAGAENVY